MSAPELSVVVPSWNTRVETLACLASLVADRSGPSRELIVIDNGSSDGSAEAISTHLPEVILIRNDRNQGYSFACNQAAERARGRLLLLLNSDVEVRSGTLERMAEFLEGHSDYGAVAPRLLNSDGSLQRACLRFPGLATAWCFDTTWSNFPPGSWVIDRYEMRNFEHSESADVVQPPAACLMMRTEEYLALGGMDSRFFVFFSDVDLCARLATAGRRIRYLADAEVLHHQGRSTIGLSRFAVTWHRDRIAYYRKRFGRWVVPYMHLVVRLRAVEEWFRLGRAADGEARAAGRADLWESVRAILAA